MPNKAKQDDPTQSQRFIDMAHEIEAEETPEAFNNLFEKLTKDQKIATSRERITSERREKSPQEYDIKDQTQD